MVGLAGAAKMILLLLMGGEKVTLGLEGDKMRNPCTHYAFIAWGGKYVSLFFTRVFDVFGVVQRLRITN